MGDSLFWLTLLLFSEIWNPTLFTRESWIERFHCELRFYSQPLMRPAMRPGAWWRGSPASFRRIAAFGKRACGCLARESKRFGAPRQNDTKPPSHRLWYDFCHWWWQLPTSKMEMSCNFLAKLQQRWCFSHFKEEFGDFNKLTRKNLETVFHHQIAMSRIGWYIDLDSWSGVYDLIGSRGLGGNPPKIHESLPFHPWATGI